jgi:hypothetical protein
MARQAPPSPPLPDPPKPPAPMEVPELVLPTTVPVRVLMRMESIAALLTGIRDVTGAASGITSGPGNQGSANVAHQMGQAGTGAVQLSMPRQMKFGVGGTVQGSSK